MGDASFLLNHQLGIARDARRKFGRQTERLVKRIGVQRLGTTEYRRHCFDGGAHNIVVGVLTGQTDAGGLAVSTQHQRALIFGRKVLLHLGCPKNPRGAQFGNFHKEIHTNGKEKRQPRRKLIDFETAIDGRAHVLDTVGDGIRQLLHIGRAGLLHMVARDRD